MKKSKQRRNNMKKFKSLLAKAINENKSGTETLEASEVLFLRPNFRPYYLVLSQ